MTDHGRRGHRGGGDPGAMEEKRALRERVWDEMEASGASRFPGARGRIPNFTGAEEAAERLRRTDVWRSADTLKANPDSPQWPVRQRALEDGKTVFMAVPRLARENPFFLLDPAAIDESPRDASSIKGASRNATPVAVEELDAVDLVVTGCVAASVDGARLGKGGGFSDLEYAVGVQAGLIAPDTPIVTTIHECQLVRPGEIPMTRHDIPVDRVVTPRRIIRTRGEHPRPGRIHWEELPEGKIAEVPLLQRLRAGG